MLRNANINLKNVSSIRDLTHTTIRNCRDHFLCVSFETYGIHTPHLILLELFG